MSRRLTTQEFIEKSIVKHGGRYDYNLVDYINSRTNVKIICKVDGHGVFEQMPNNHLNGANCSKCSKVYKRNTVEFIDESILIHGDKYDYSLVEYKGNHNLVNIICKKHGVFNQQPAKHLDGSGCQKCRGRNLKTTEEFINEAIEVNGYEYDYNLVEYVNNRHKVTVICKKHDKFLVTPNNHLRGKGCPKCAIEIIRTHHSKNPVGWTVTNWELRAKDSKVFDSFKVYIIKCWNEKEEFYKIGRTFRKTKERFKSGLPYNYEILQEIVFDNARDCFNKETELKRLHKEHKYLPLIKFCGRNECFNNVMFNKLDGLS